MHPFHDLRTKNPNAYEKELQKTNPGYAERRRQYQKDYLKEKSSSHEFRWKANERAKAYFRRKRELIIWLLGSKCRSCSFIDKRALQIDHVYGGGNQVGRQQGASYYKEILESIERGENKYQLLCANCNWIKRVEQKECYKRIRTTKRGKEVEKQ
jgi:hypothetical protein